MKRATDEQPPKLTTLKCLRLIRPFIAKIHSLTDLYAKQPALLDFDTEKCSLMLPKEVNQFICPKTPQQRLENLRPYLQPEVFEAYYDLFFHFKSIVSLVFELNTVSRKDKGTYERVSETSHCIPNCSVLRLSTLSAAHLGKHVVLGTKTTFPQVNQAMVFDKETFPAHLRVFADDLEDGIENWLNMEPTTVLDRYKSSVFMGYMIHLLVINLTTLFYTFIPVLVHWLHHHKMPLSKYFFTEYWSFLVFNPDLRGVRDFLPSTHDPSSKVFWLFESNGYWRQFTNDIAVSGLYGCPGTFEPYESLVLDALANTEKVVGANLSLSGIYGLMKKNLQYPLNTSIMMLILSQFIDSNYKKLNVVTNSEDAYLILLKSYNSISEFLSFWLAFDENCIFHNLDSGNSRIFESLLKLSKFNTHHLTRIEHYLEKRKLLSRIKATKKKFSKLSLKLRTQMTAIQILRSFNLNSVFFSYSISEPATMVVNYIWFLFEDSAEIDQVDDFVDWLFNLNDEYLRAIAEKLEEVKIHGPPRS